MIASFFIDKNEFQVDFSNAQDISIPMRFDKIEPNNYSVPFSNAKPYIDKNFIGSVKQGGSCNFDVISLIPHCNGTHTECLGHITKEKQSINQTLQNPNSIALLITVKPKTIKERQTKCNKEDLSKIEYKPEIDPENDKIITAYDITNTIFTTFHKEISETQEKQLLFKKIPVQSIIIRTKPNDDNKKIRNYIQSPPAFLTVDASKALNNFAIKHLVLDLPSIDKQFDQGLLSSHHEFWGLTNNNDINNTNQDTYKKTITEFAFIDDEIKDGLYFLSLQIAPFELDASPSKPILYNIIK